jgi:hypothetical protein
MYTSKANNPFSNKNRGENSRSTEKVIEKLIKNVQK